VINSTLAIQPYISRSSSGCLLSALRQIRSCLLGFLTALYAPFIFPIRTVATLKWRQVLVTFNQVRRETKVCVITLSRLDRLRDIIVHSRYACGAAAREPITKTIILSDKVSTEMYHLLDGPVPSAVIKLPLSLT